MVGRISRTVTYAENLHLLRCFVDSLKDKVRIAHDRQNPMPGRAVERQLDGKRASPLIARWMRALTAAAARGL
jgi:hypothetical protein